MYIFPIFLGPHFPLLQFGFFFLNLWNINFFFNTPQCYVQSHVLTHICICVWVEFILCEYVYIGMCVFVCVCSNCKWVYTLITFRSLNFDSFPFTFEYWQNFVIWFLCIDSLIMLFSVKFSEWVCVWACVFLCMCGFMYLHMWWNMWKSYEYYSECWLKLLGWR